MLALKERHFLPFIVALVLGFTVVSCSTGPSGPAPGTPGFYWNAASQTFATGDYAKTASNLEELVKKQNEFTARAVPWRLVITSGLAKGYAELADSFEAGSRANRAKPTPFRTEMADLRRMAGVRALQFAETFLQFKNHDHSQAIPLDFPYPTGNPAAVAELGRISSGVLLPDAQLQSVQKRVLERAVLLNTFAAAGAPDDAAKAQDLFKGGNLKVDHDTFVLAMADNLHSLSKLYSREKLDEPDRVELFCNEGLEALKNVKETKESKKLADAIQKTLKPRKR